MVCKNMLYIKIDEDKNLINYCKNCNYIEKDDNNNSSKIIMESDYSTKNVNYGMHLNKFIKFDPTIPRVNNILCKNKECSKPSDKDNVTLIIKYDTVNLKYLYSCYYCDHFWTNNID
jgi:hypothetical protein